MDKVGRRKEVWKKTNGVCAHCGRAVSPQRQTVDHFIPKSWGGSYDMRNLVPLCQECNWERKADEINPSTFYKYAPQHVIRMCLSYKRQWEENTCSMYEWGLA